MDQRDKRRDPTPGIIEEPRAGASMMVSPNKPARNPNVLDLIGIVAATGLIWLPLFAGALRG